MPGLDAVVTINPDIAFRELDGEMVILNLQTGIYFGLDVVGARAWTLIRDLGSLAAVSAALGAEYDVAPGVLERDLLALVEQLCAKGLARVSTNAAA